MATTTNLGITLLEEAQAAKVAAINAALNTLDAAAGGMLTKSVAGGSNVALTATEASNAILKFTGTLTGNIDVTVPVNTKRTWTVWDATSGAFSITFKVAGGTGVKTRQGKVDIFFSDGTNMDLSAPGTTVRHGGTSVATRRNISISNTGSVTWTIADDATNDEIDISATSTGGSGSGDSTFTSAYASRPAASNAGDLFLPSDGFAVDRDTGSAWAAWGPLFPLTRPVLGDFTAVNQGGATIDDTKGGLALIAPLNSGDNVRIRKMAAPATPYVITAGFLPGLPGGNYFVTGLCFRESSSGKLHTWALSYSGSWGIRTEKWTNPTTFNADYSRTVIPMMLGPVLWLRISDDGTNRKCFFSGDGQNFTEIHSVGRTDFLTADEVGFFLNVNNGLYGAVTTLISWKQT